MKYSAILAVTLFGALCFMKLAHAREGGISGGGSPPRIILPGKDFSYRCDIVVQELQANIPFTAVETTVVIDKKDFQRGGIGGSKNVVNLSRSLKWKAHFTSRAPLTMPQHLDHRLTMSFPWADSQNNIDVKKPTVVFAIEAARTDNSSGTAAEAEVETSFNSRKPIKVKASLQQTSNPGSLLELGLSVEATCVRIK